MTRGSLKNGLICEMWLALLIFHWRWKINPACGIDFLRHRLNKRNWAIGKKKNMRLVPPLHRTDENKDHSHLSSPGVQLRRVCTTFFNLVKKEKGQNFYLNIICDILLRWPTTVTAKEITLHQNKEPRGKRNSRCPHGIKDERGAETSCRGAPWEKKMREILHLPSQKTEEFLKCLQHSIKIIWGHHYLLLIVEQIFLAGV